MSGSGNSDHIRVFEKLISHKLVFTAVIDIGENYPLLVKPEVDVALVTCVLQKSETADDAYECDAELQHEQCQGERICSSELQFTLEDTDRLKPADIECGIPASQQSSKYEEGGNEQQKSVAAEIIGFQLHL